MLLTLRFLVLMLIFEDAMSFLELVVVVARLKNLGGFQLGSERVCAVVFVICQKDVFLQLELLVVLLQDEIVAYWGLADVVEVDNLLDDWFWLGVPDAISLSIDLRQERVDWVQSVDLLHEFFIWLDIIPIAEVGVVLHQLVYAFLGRPEVVLDDPGLFLLFLLNRLQFIIFLVYLQLSCGLHLPHVILEKLDALLHLYRLHLELVA